MGAALTYARRYALFTLVGIAGEDDLDAPDLLGATSSEGSPETSGNSHRANGHADAVPTPAVRYNGKRLHRIPKPSLPVLDAAPSAALRDRLVSEIARLQSAETAVAWANRGLIAKNRLVAEDAQTVEAAFRDRMRTFEEASREAAPSTTDSAKPDQPIDQSSPLQKPVEKIAERATHPVSLGQQINGGNCKLRRFRDKEHLRFVAKQPCTVCGRQPCEPHHIRFAQPRAISRKVSDEFTVPLCRLHHREIHRRGDEAAWWVEFGIDPLPIALRLWQETRGVGGPPDEKPQRSAAATDQRIMAVSVAEPPANLSSEKNASS